MSLTFVAVGHVDDIPPLGGRCVQTARGPVGVFRTADDAVFALDNRCPHRGGPLSEGIVHGRSVTCPLHGAVLSLESGAVEGPDGGGVATIPVQVVDGEIRLGLVLDDAAARGDAGVGVGVGAGLHAGASVLAEAPAGDKAAPMQAPAEADLGLSAQTTIEAGRTPVQAPAEADLALSAQAVIEAGRTPPTLPNTATRRVAAGEAA